MALPASLDKASPANTDNPSQGAAQIRALKTFLEDVFGLVDVTNYTAGAFGITAAGLVSVKQTPFAPDSSDGSALGSTSKMWSDLFLASGGVLNWNNGNATVTHSAGILTVAGAALAVTAIADPGAATASTARIFAYTSGGKVIIGARFPSGAIQDIASEP